MRIILDTNVLVSGIFFSGPLERLGFETRIRSSHHMFRKEGVEEKINLQKEHGKAKPYQVRQVRNIILKYKLGDQ